MESMKNGVFVASSKLKDLLAYYNNPMNDKIQRLQMEIDTVNEVQSENISKILKAQTLINDLVGDTERLDDQAQEFKRHTQKAKCFMSLDHLSKDVISELKEVFSLFDEDGNGSISMEELGNVMEQLSSRPSDEELLHMFKLVDENHDGKIEFDEFVKLWTSQCSQPTTDEELKLFFDTFDKDRSGFIDRKEMAEILEAMGETISEEKIDTILQDLKLDKNPQISFEQFKQFLSQK
ncbi:hypothetical protein FDP41_007015 [Naegleria fowleri]|nr:uncharacterized protein FDP41_007015 [Naegleria fowleri]KAF0973983.1 hypothetical protein FDP41_007015 [Naegleria fowleri]